MEAFQIDDVRGFMGHMLQKDTFDDFLLCEAEIRGKASLELDGHLPNDFYSPEESEERSSEGGFSSYGDLRPLCFEAVRGKHTPGYMKFVFGATNSLRGEILSGQDVDPEDVTGFYINAMFRDGQLTTTTGTSMRTFTMDKTAETLWDQWFRNFLERVKISYTNMA
jgi:hypothetical protein